MQLLASPLQESTRHIHSYHWFGSYGNHFPISGHVAVNSELLHHLLPQEVHLGSLSMDQHHMTWGGLGTEASQMASNGHNMEGTWRISCMMPLASACALERETSPV